MRKRDQGIVQVCWTIRNLVGPWLATVLLVLPAAAVFAQGATRRKPAAPASSVSPVPSVCCCRRISTPSQGSR